MGQNITVAISLGGSGSSVLKAPVLERRPAIVRWCSRLMLLTRRGSVRVLVQRRREAVGPCLWWVELGPGQLLDQIRIRVGIHVSSRQVYWANIEGNVGVLVPVARSVWPRVGDDMNGRVGHLARHCGKDVYRLIGLVCFFLLWDNIELVGWLEGKKIVPTDVVLVVAGRKAGQDGVDVCGRQSPDFFSQDVLNRRPI